MTNRPVQVDIEPCDYEIVRELEQELRVTHVTAQVLARRGFTDVVAAREWLEASVTHGWDQFEGIESAVELVREHIASGKRITVHGDYDADGVCATAIMVRSLRRLGANVDSFLPSRFDQGYGIALETVDLLAARGTSLLISVDCGITAIESVARARELGVDVVITDHHTPLSSGELPTAPVIHPVIGKYPTDVLCGTAVAYKFAQALESGSACDGAVNEDLDLVAIATVADVMKLVDENRRLVREGLVALSRTTKPGLRALMKLTRIEPAQISERDIGFRIAPRLNAAGRMYHADAALELVLTEDVDRAEEIASELHAANAERRDSEREILNDAKKQITEQGERFGYVVAGEGWHKGVVGIVAARLAERVRRPVVAIAVESGEGSGSGRAGIAEFDLLKALGECSDHLPTYGGHRAAAGLTIPQPEIEAFRDAFALAAESQLANVDLTPRERVDAVAGGTELSLETADELRSLGPFGQGNPQVNLLVPAVRLSDPVGMGEGKHVRFTVRSGSTNLKAVRFGAGDELPADPDESVHAVCRLERNEWNGSVEVRLELRSLGELALAGITHPFVRTFQQRVVETLEMGERHDLNEQKERAQIDATGRGVSATVADLVSADVAPLIVCAHRDQRFSVLDGVLGGFDLIEYDELELIPELVERYRHIVAIDPPLWEGQADLLICGDGYVHCAWGEGEARFTEQVRAYSYQLRPHLIELFTSLRTHQTVAGTELERLLAGSGHWPRTAEHAAMMIKVLSELELATFDRDRFQLTLISEMQTDLSRSTTHEAYYQRYKDGLKSRIEQTETAA